MSGSTLENRRLRGNLIALCSFLRRACEEEGAELFSLACMGYMGMGGSCARGDSDGHQEAFPYREGGQILEQASLRGLSLQCLKPSSVRESFGQSP